MGFPYWDCRTNQSTSKGRIFDFIKATAERSAAPWQSWADAWNPRAQSRATRTRGQASGGPPAPPGRGQWSSCCCPDWMDCSSGWCSGWCSGRCPGSRRFLWCSSSLGEKRWAGATCRGPAGRSSFLRAGIVMRGRLVEPQQDLFQCTDEVFHHLGVVSVEDGGGEPAEVELDVSLRCFDVFLVADVHRFSPVSPQRDSN